VLTRSTSASGQWSTSPTLPTRGYSTHHRL